MQSLCEEAQAWACAHGVQMGSAGSSFHMEHAPMTLLPTPLDRKAFELAVMLAKPYNELVDKCARDMDWVFQTLDGVLQGDTFTKKLVEIAKLIENEGGPLQRTYLGINRSDYMLDQGKDLKQVEINTIAASFGCLSSRVARMHRFLLERHGLRNPFIAEVYHKSAEELVASLAERLPENNGESGIANAIAKAAKLHRERLAPSLAANFASQPPLVVFVVQDGERNSFDQRWIEYELWERHQVIVVRKSLGQLMDQAALGEGRELILGDRIVSVVYYRAGYTPNDYPSEKQWDARILVERSAAIKCPSIQYHLCGAKKVQQALAAPGAVERFMSAQDSELLRRSFAGLWTLDASEQDDAARAAVADALVNPIKYVVKPQREGGGNNTYGPAVAEALRTLPPDELASNILMSRIFPLEQDSFLMRKGQVISTKVIQELGIYGTFLGDPGAVLLNEPVGHLVRTKQVGVDEGGVATGYSCLDSPFLLDL